MYECMWQFLQVDHKWYMMKDKYCLNVERERLRECMEDITFQLVPNDENKERVLEGLEYEDEGDDLDLDFTMGSVEDDK